MHGVEILVWLALTTIVTVTVEGISLSTSCDDGWVQFKSKCYQFSHDYEQAYRALEQCHSRDAILAYATDERELNFLTYSVKGMDAYAWMTGLSSYNPRSNQGAKLRVDGRYSGIDNADNFPKPQLHRDPDVSYNCIAYRPHYKNEYVHSYGFTAGMTTVDCHIKLPYVCSGTTDSVKSTDNSNYIQNGTKDIFYVSKPHDRRNYSEAQTICRLQGMSLLSIRNQHILNFMDKTLGNRSINQLEPWWTGFKVSYNPLVYNWTGNVPMNESVISWLQIPEYLYFLRYLLLGSGKAMVIGDLSVSSAPYICMKNSTVLMRYHCKPGWIRGGGSCYKFVSNDYLTWDKAAMYCSNAGSHLLSINSKDEMTWLLAAKMMNRIFRMNGIWTSLNDRKQENEFIWSDGSKLDKGIVDWVKPIEESLEIFITPGQCIKMTKGELLPTSCNEEGYYGCQYKTSTGKCQDDDWDFFNGYCYLTHLSNAYSHMRFNNAKAVCRTLVDDRHVTPEVVKIESKEVYNFLAKAYDIFSVGIGLNSLIVPGSWTWADGTKADLSIFPHITEPNNGGGNGEEDCVAIGNHGGLFDTACNQKKSFICEKEIQLTKTPIAGKVDSAGAGLCKFSHGMTLVLFSVLMWFTV